MWVKRLHSQVGLKGTVELTLTELGTKPFRDRFRIARLNFDERNLATIPDDRLRANRLYSTVRDTCIDKILKK